MQPDRAPIARLELVFDLRSANGFSAPVTGLLAPEARPHARGQLERQSTILDLRANLAGRVRGERHSIRIMGVKNDGRQPLEVLCELASGIIGLAAYSKRAPSDGPARMPEQRSC